MKDNKHYKYGYMRQTCKGSTKCKNKDYIDHDHEKNMIQQTNTKQQLVQRHAQKHFISVGKKWNRKYWATETPLASQLAKRQV